MKRLPLRGSRGNNAFKPALIRTVPADEAVLMLLDAGRYDLHILMYAAILDLEYSLRVARDHAAV